jgi:hypothetical protein
MSGMSPAAGADDAPRASRKRFAWWGASSLAISIFLHGLFIAIAAIFVVAHFQRPKHTNFQAAPPAAVHNEVEHKVELAKRTSSQSAPPDLKRITTTAVATITLPDVPDSPVTDVVTPSPMSGVGDGVGIGSGGGGQGDGRGAGNGDGLDLPEVKEQLSKLLFQLPCNDDGACPLTDDHDFTVRIADRQQHTCTLHIRGVVEPRTYEGGHMIKDYLNVGGNTEDKDIFNIYELSVDDPPQTYYLNAGKSHSPVCVIDYTMQITVKDQSRVRLHADSIDNAELTNSDHLSAPDNNPDQPIMVQQPFKGQFIQMDTVSIDE